jgi:puromycin-sensitive aminopeptidase
MTYCLCRRLGWDSISGEDHSNSLLRGEIFEALATFGHDKTQQEARRCFQILLNDRNTSLLSANTRKVTFKLLFPSRLLVITLILITFVLT